MQFSSGLIVVWCYHFHPHTDHYTGKQLSPQALTCLHVMLWDRACKYFEVLYVKNNSQFTFFHYVIVSTVELWILNVGIRTHLH